MAPPTTLYRFRLTTGPNDSKLDIRVAQHPSETKIFLVTRVIAYALNVKDGIEFTTGLADPDLPAIRVIGNHGEIAHWIDIGNPSAKRMHKAAKAATAVSIYTYKDISQWKKEIVDEKIYNAHKIKLFSLDSDFLEELASDLSRDNQWQIKVIDEELEITTANDVFTGSLQRHSI
jgi:uncharacterized protein YaeQ